MAIVGGLDIHRRQITYDILDTDTGETRRGRIEPATSTNLRAWLEQLGRQPAAFALEATTGWRFVVDELHHAGMDAPPGRAGRHPRAAWPQAARQDRPCRRPPPA